MGTWIDFKKLREELDFAVVLQHYGVQLKAGFSGQHQGHCPLPMHQKEMTSKTFSANLKKKVWRCFTCNVSGNLLDFAVYAEGLNPNNHADVRKVALLLQERFCGKSRPATPTHSAKSHTATPREPQNAAALAEKLNVPLDFALKNLDGEHVFFRKRGLLPATVSHFGLGFCTKGMCAGRIAIPLYNSDGQLIGYAGKLTDEFEVTDNEAEYVWPATRERGGVKHLFDRGKFLYHGNTIKESVTDLVVVQSPESVWHLWQIGYFDVVGIMSDVPSLEQSKRIIQLVRPKGRIWLLPDGSKVGERCAAELFFDLGPHRFCRWVKLSERYPSE